MSAVGAFLPFLIIFIFILGIFYFIQSKNINLMTKKHKRQQRFYLTNKKILWMVCSYIIILILSAGIYGFIPQKSVPSKSNITDDEYDKINNQIYDRAFKGKIEKIDPSFISSKWKKKYSGKQLTITATNPGETNTAIVIERKKTNDSLIEGTYFHTKSYIDGIDVTDKIPANQLKWSKGTLTFVQPEPLKLTYTLFDKDTLLRQFTNDASIHGGRFSSNFGSQILYLRIPKDLKIIDYDNIWIEYVGKSTKD